MSPRRAFPFRRTARAACAGALALALLQTISAAQWSVDPTTTALRIEAELYADQECNNPPATSGPIPRPGPLDLQGACPPMANPPLHADSSILFADAMGFNFPSVFFDLGNGLDFLVDDNFGPGCAPPLATLGVTDTAAFFQGFGLGSRTLRLSWNAELHQLGSDPDFYMRGCTQLEGSLVAAFAVPQTNDPVLLRFDLESEGGADTHWECPDPGGFCALVLPPGPEDTEHASMDVRMGLSGGAPAALLDVDLHSDPLTGLPDVWPPQVLSQAAVFAAGTSSIDVAVEVFAETGATTQFPYVGLIDEGEVDFGGRLTLHVILHDFVMDPQYMRMVPKGGAGPRYAYSVGRTEITNQEYADFLNSAELDGGATGLGSFMVFGVDGTVTLPSGDPLFRPRGAGAPDSRIVYSPFAPVGTRYTVEVAQKADPRSFEDHPVNHVTWLGAVKFCNWLTLDQGLAPAERCYTEGPTPDDWHPATISTADWATRDLTRAERARLVLAHEGFRLPMDELGSATGWVGSQVRRFNEWYKAAAFDPNAPATARGGPAGETVPPGHWVFGFGRDLFTGADANTLQSGDPFDDGDAFVALYDGTTYNTPGMPAVGNGAVFASNAGANPWGINDLSGNVAEWIQDQVPGQGMAVRGGSWKHLFAESAATWRDGRPLTDAAPWLGFRVVRSMPMKTLPAPGASPTPVTFPRVH